jgi:hypothetical protein
MKKQTWKLLRDQNKRDLVLQRVSNSGEPELEVIFEWKRFGKRAEVVLMQVQSPGKKRPISFTDIRSIPFSEIAKMERQALSRGSSKGGTVPKGSVNGPQSGRPLSEKDLRVVVNLYRTAHELSIPIAPYLASELQISTSTANKRIAAARRAGLLGPSNSTRSGESEKPLIIRRGS